MRGWFLSSYVPQKLELKTCPIHCLLSQVYDGCWKEWRFAENKIRNILFFTNTKTTKFISFLFDLFFPRKKDNKMSSLKETYCTTHCVSRWDAREQGVRHLQWTVLNALLFLRMTLQCGGRKWNKGRRDVEYAVLPTVRIQSWLWFKNILRLDGSTAKLFHLQISPVCTS